jgi:excinuclease ABC subunit A
VREELSKYISEQPCPECHGARLNKAAQRVRGRPPLPDLVVLPIDEALKFFSELSLPGWRGEIADEDRQGNRRTPRLPGRRGPGLPDPGAQADTLSGGEAQRIRLASQIGAGLVGVMYVLDEPSIGLHQRDNDRLLGTLTACATSATR